MFGGDGGNRTCRNMLLHITLIDCGSFSDHFHVKTALLKLAIINWTPCLGIEPASN